VVRVSTDGCNLPCQFDGLEEDSLHAREQSMGRFVICRDQQGAATASFGQRFFGMNCEPGERSKDKQDEADEHSEERKRNPRKQRDYNSSTMVCTTVGPFTLITRYIWYAAMAVREGVLPSIRARRSRGVVGRLLSVVGGSQSDCSTISTGASDGTAVFAVPAPPHG
jgi:hypothetical protein